MERTALYLLGIPGAGKSTLMAAVLPRRERSRAPVLHVAYPGGVVLGDPWPERADFFPGTDLLDRTEQRDILHWLAGPDAPTVVVGEGIKFATRLFLTALQALGYAVHAVTLDTPLPIAAARCVERAGSGNELYWLEREALALTTLTREWTDPAWRLDGCLRPAQLAARLRRHPVLRRLTDTTPAALASYRRGAQEELESQPV